MGKRSPKAPDYTPMANASAEATRISAELGREQIAEARRQYDSDRAALAPIVDAQMGIMNQSKQQGDDYYNYLKTTFRPLEQGIVADANNFDTEGAREGLARSAVLDTQRAQAGAQAQATRALTSMGVNPNSGRFAGQQKALGLQNAAMRAGAATGARTQSEAMGYARKMDAAGLGRNLPGASTGAYQVATGAGNSAGQNSTAPGGKLMAGLAAGSGTIMQGQGMGIQGLGSALAGQQAGYNAGIQANNGMWSGLGSLAGVALGKWG